MTNKLTKTFEKNELGRDFVVGDIHGSMQRIEELFAAVNFDPSKDRLFCVGDLIDRGPDSFNTLFMLEQPYVHSVMGNHEDLMCMFLLRAFPGFLWSNNGGDWFFKLTSEQKDAVRTLCNDVVQHLPWLITVELGDNKRFHVLHAELSWPNEITDGDLLTDFDEIGNVHSYDGPMALWGRKLFQDLYRARLTEGFLGKVRRAAQIDKSAKWMQSEHLSNIYVGHSIMRQPTVFGKMINLDTCGFGSFSNMDDAGLTMTEPKTGKFWQATREGVLEVQAKVVL